MTEIDDDPVVAEYDVYLSHHKGRKLFCLEYDSRPNDRPYELSDVQVRVKPNIPKVEMKVPMLDCEEYINDRDFNLILTSNKPVSKTQNNALGLFINNEFHLFSEPEILQMYPSIEKKKTTENDVEEDKREISIVPRFQPRATEAEKNRELASYQYMKNKEDQESWINVVCRNVDSHTISSLTQHSTNVSVEFDMTPKEYFEACIPRLGDEVESEQVKVKQTPCVKTNSAMQNNNTNNAITEEKLVAFAKEKLYSRTIMSLQEFQELGLLNTSFFLPKTKKELEEVIISAGGVVLKTSKTNTVYTTKSKGDHKDAIRECLVNLLIAKPALKLALLKAELEKKGIVHKNEAELKLILKEYCDTKGGSWISKGQKYD